MVGTSRGASAAYEAVFFKEHDNPKTAAISGWSHVLALDIALLKRIIIAQDFFDLARVSMFFVP